MSAPQPASFLKFLFLTMGVGTKAFDLADLSDDEKTLVNEAMFDGRDWVHLVIEELNRNGDPLSDTLRAKVMRDIAGTSNKTGSSTR